MKGFKGQNFNDRLSASNTARQAAVEKLKAKLDPNRPEAVEKRAERLALAQAREARLAEREAARVAEIERQEAERLAREVNEKAEQEDKKRRETEKLQELLAEQKAARDARYAARKARTKK
jgi:membrane protein involved in colicin uptake